MHFSAQLTHESGQTAVEYALVLGFVCLLVAAGLASAGATWMATILDSISARIS